MYTDIKYMNVSDSNYYESKTSNEVIEEDEYTSVITEHKKNYQPVMFSSFGKSLSGVSMAVPIILSALGNARGSQVSFLQFVCSTTITV